ncbi:MAG TPA: hypothetical protein DIU15_15905 [Deltaproteobacteria bacterium]|mgnify:CR=1 FL=1|nr:hypothetical protein [Deltaproteobacteria bacterium]HCP47526.1 hypothetical protein [Deltaproteobacteria bacterium]
MPLPSWFRMRFWRSRTALVVLSVLAVGGAAAGGYYLGLESGRSQGFEWGVRKGKAEAARLGPPASLDKGHSREDLAEPLAALGPMDEAELDMVVRVANRAPSPCAADARRGVSLATALVEPDKACPQFALAQLKLASVAVGTFREEGEALAVLRVEKRADLVVEGRAFRGNPEAAVTLAEWGDFQCPYCGRIQPLLSDILAARSDVRIVFKHMPLGFHAAAIPAGLAVEAAGEQGRFWEMHDALFELGRDVGDGIDPDEPVPEEGSVPFEALAGELGLDIARFRSDMRSDRLMQRVLDDRDEGRRIGVRGTPTLFVNGRKVEERLGLVTLSALIDKALAERDGHFSWDLKAPDGDGVSP